MECQIRLATLDDLPRIVAIYNSTIPRRDATADLEPINVESRKSWLKDRNMLKRPVWIASSDGTIAGWLSLSSYKEREGYKHTVEIGIYIDENFQRSSVGKQLMMHALREAPKAGIKNIIAVIFGHNERSILFFKKFEFEQWGLLPRVTEMDGVERDVVIYGKRIS